MTQRMLYESGHDGRSVLGMVAVQVERDPKTGATVVRSVAPVSVPSSGSAAAAAAMSTTVFDDGRKSVHAIGGRGGQQPSAEELGQILSAIDDGVGMRVLLDEVTVNTAPRRGEAIREEEEEEEGGRGFSYLTQYPSGEAAEPWVRNGAMGSDRGTEECPESGGEDEEDDEGEDSSMVVVREFIRTVDEAEDGGGGGGAEYGTGDGPVTLTFLGYADAAGGQGQTRDDHGGGTVMVERVIITDDGEERKLEPADTTAAPPGEGPEAASEATATTDLGGGGGPGKVGGATKDGAFQDVNLDGNGAAIVDVQGEAGGPPRKSSASPPTRAAVEGAPKRKTRQCCSVM